MAIVFAKRIDTILNALIKELNYCKNNEIVKYLFFVLDEAKINAENNQFFDFKLELFDEFLSDNITEKWYSILIQLENERVNYYRHIIYDLINDNYKLCKNTIDSFLDKLIKHTDLFEELSNYVLNDDTFEEDHKYVTIQRTLKNEKNQKRIKKINVKNLIDKGENIYTAYEAMIFYIENINKKYEVI